ncbi:hypothetical protein OSB04_021307 [Centaurea solstitialis]|uniref:IspG C-terminal domain-containing protein n=1 Tax=Centaurea solstitialis TaxID=347529 RepID=A0AA38WG44_9ASTR|nr:hypothetical protein OSB04_021307 [Centaurea solstitialis]
MPLTALPTLTTRAFFILAFLEATPIMIAIMGCIVNGPGEMAGADFGYVGSAPGNINLYVGKTMVKRGIAMVHADGGWILLLKSRNSFQELLI